MNRIEALEKRVREVYEKNSPGRVPEGDWLYKNHVFQVAVESRKVAEKYGGEPELAYVAGLLHDIADSEMDRFNDGHEERSREIAAQLLNESGFTDSEIQIVVDDALRHHSCRGDERPLTAEGKAMAAGDAVVHLNTNFYDYFLATFRARGETEADIQAWIDEKTTRDLINKIPFEDLRASLKPRYEEIRRLVGL
jgi:HD superfamily phosphodiesterase